MRGGCTSQTFKAAPSFIGPHDNHYDHDVRDSDGGDGIDGGDGGDGMILHSQNSRQVTATTRFF